MLKKMALLGLGFIGGIVTYAALYVRDVEQDGDVAYEDEHIKVLAGGNKSKNWAFGKVEYKQDKPKTEEE